MTIIGENVILKKSLMTGVVMAQAEDKGFYIIRAWNTDRKEYVMIQEHELHMETVTNPFFQVQANMDDKAVREELFRHMTDMALDSGDKEWFDAIQEQKRAYRQPVDESEFEKNRLRPGQMVVDTNGQNGGVVLFEMKHKKNFFVVRAWSTKLQDYVNLERSAGGLVVVHAPSWKTQPNRDDEMTKESVHQAFTDIAMSLNDIEWLKDLHHSKEAQESDGA